MKASMFILTIIIISTFCSTALAAETHVFFTQPILNNRFDPYSYPPPKYNLTFDGRYTVAGDYAEDFQVYYEGDECVFEPASGALCLSMVQNYYGGGRGLVTIEVPYSVRAVEIVYFDHTAYKPYVNGPQLMMTEMIWSRHGYPNCIQTLDQNVGDPGKVGELVHQFFIPGFTNYTVSGNSTLTLDAWAYDGIIVKRISFYDFSPLDYDTDLYYGVTGSKTEAFTTNLVDELEFYKQEVLGRLY